MQTCEKPASDRQGQLLALLAGLSGHLQATSPQDERSIRSLQKTLARVLPDEDITTVRSSFFSVENSDLFFMDTIAPQQLQGLNDLASQAVKEPRTADLRVFVRDVPVRSAQMKGSLPLWAGGAAPKQPWGLSSTRMAGRSGLTFTGSKNWWRSTSTGGRTRRFSSTYP